MVQTDCYARILEKRLIDEFKSKFYQKLGYHPVVVTQTKITGKDVPILTLEELSKCFNKYMPRGKDGKFISLKSKKRTRELTDLRKMYCTIARTMGFTLSEIGKFLGNRDHTTIIHNIFMFKSLYETNEAFKLKYNSIIRTINEKYGTSIMEDFDKTQPESKPNLSSRLLPTEN